MIDPNFLIPILLGIGNIIFFIAGLPQVYSTYKNRKTTLKAINPLMLLGYSTACLLFTIAGFIGGNIGYLIMGACNAINVSIFLTQLYWKKKYGRKEI